MAQNQLARYIPAQDVARHKATSANPLDIIATGVPTTLEHRAGIREVIPFATDTNATRTDDTNTTRVADGDRQAEKRDMLNRVKKAVAEGAQNLSANDIKAIGSFIMSLSPEGRSELMSAPFGRGAMLSQTRGRNVSTIDTLEHYAIVREVKRIKQEYLKTKLDNENSATEIDRLMWSVRKTDEAVALQTLPLAR